MESIKKVETIGRGGRRGGGVSSLAKKSSFRYLLKAIRHKSENRACSVSRDSESNGPSRPSIRYSRRNNFRDVYAKCSAIQRQRDRLFPRVSIAQERKNNKRNSQCYMETICYGDTSSFPRVK